MNKPWASACEDTEKVAKDFELVLNREGHRFNYTGEAGNCVVTIWAKEEAPRYCATVLAYDVEPEFGRSFQTFNISSLIEIINLLVRARSES